MTPSWLASRRRPAFRTGLRQLALYLLVCAVGAGTGATALSTAALGAGRPGAAIVRQWKAIQAPMPRTAAADPDVSVRQLTCTGVGACVGVGAFTNELTVRSGVIEQLRNRSWKATGAPVPRGASPTANAVLTSVSCPSSASCGVAGYLVTAVNRQPELLVLRAGRWSAQAAPLARGTIPSSPTVLISISCPRPGSCVAAGRYQGTHGYYQGLLDVQSGSRWRAVQAPVPSDTARNPVGGADWVSCPRAGRCTTVGAYVDSKGNRELFADTLRGGSWRSARLPLPAGAAADPFAYLDYVTCQSPADCLAVGNFNTSGGATQGLFEREVSGVWHATKAPLPPGAAENPGATINEASCPTSRFCAATGDYQNTAGDNWGVLETLSRGTWRAVAAPAPATDRTNRYMDSVSCPIAQWCVAAGSTNISGLLETYAGGRWTATVAPLPSPGSNALFLSTSVSCRPARMCAAFGAFTKHHGTTPQGQGLLETYGG